MNEEFFDDELDFEFDEFGNSNALPYTHIEVNKEQLAQHSRGLEHTQSSAVRDYNIDIRLVNSMKTIDEYEAAQYWLSRGANPKAFRSLALTLCEQARTTRLLIRSGAQLHDVRDRAFWRAVYDGNLFKMKVLLYNGAYIDEAKLSATFYNDDVFDALTEFFDTYVQPHKFLRYFRIKEKYFRLYYKNKDFLDFFNSADVTKLSDDDLLNKLLDYSTQAGVGEKVLSDSKRQVALASARILDL